MFQALFFYHQEALHTQQLVYFVRFMSGGCYQGWSSAVTLVAASRHNTHKIYQLLCMQYLLMLSK
jgi:hypothetical protein